MLFTPLKDSKWRLLYLSSLCIPNNNVYSANDISSENPVGKFVFFPFQAISWLKKKCISVLGEIHKSEMFISSLSTDANHLPVSVLMSIISFSNHTADVNRLLPISVLNLPVSVLM
ncbi:unnamed protein product [Vicia faba]|uniref:Uncharacterized protein n=1 Tax=Vicia faba TaxID=3906 RepID=A0AAV1B1R5_VICFA|nr:unnamed protein product [Vicia faba]